MASWLAPTRTSNRSLLDGKSSRRIPATTTPDAGPGSPIDADARPIAARFDLIGGGNARPSDDRKERSPPAISDGERSLARGSRPTASIRDPDSPAAGSRA